MDRATFSILLKNELKKWAQEIKFSLYKQRILIAEKQSILRVIDFDLGTIGFACDIAVQPLYVPWGYIVLSFGDRIGLFADTYQDRYSYGSTKEEAMENLKKVESLVLKYGLTWFEEVGTPEKLIKFLESERVKLVFRCPELTKLIYKGMSLLKLGELNQGAKFLHKAKTILEDMPIEWAQVDLELVTSILEVIRQGEQNVAKKLLEIEKYTRGELRIQN